MQIMRRHNNDDALLSLRINRDVACQIMSGSWQSPNL
jgi:hypothetical protein